MCKWIIYFKKSSQFFECDAHLALHGLGREAKMGSNGWVGHRFIATERENSSASRGKSRQGLPRHLIEVFFGEGLLYLRRNGELMKRRLTCREGHDVIFVASKVVERTISANRVEVGFQGGVYL